jgi:hypothetical protein
MPSNETSACALALFMRRLARHEPDITDEIDACFGDGGPLSWINSYPGHLCQLRLAIDALPRDWWALGAEGRVRSVHARFPPDILAWVRDDVCKLPQNDQTREWASNWRYSMCQLRSRLVRNLVRDLPLGMFTIIAIATTNHHASASEIARIVSVRRRNGLG